MTNSSGNSSFRIEKDSVVAIAAGVLVGLGIILQLSQIILTRLLAQDAWFFVTAFQTGWSLLNVSFAGGPWLEAIHYWPLLLSIAGAAILLSRRPKRA
jgi:hypothetical protein